MFTFSIFYWFSFFFNIMLPEMLLFPRFGVKERFCATVPDPWVMPLNYWRWHSPSHKRLRGLRVPVPKRQQDKRRAYLIRPWGNLRLVLPNHLQTGVSRWIFLYLWEKDLAFASEPCQTKFNCSSIPPSPRDASSGPLPAGFRGRNWDLESGRPCPVASPASIWSGWWLLWLSVFSLYCFERGVFAFFSVFIGWNFPFLNGLCPIFLIPYPWIVRRHQNQSNFKIY